jgi:hypothetical protein
MKWRQNAMHVGEKAMSVVYIPVSNTEFAIVDMDDLPRLLPHGWCKTGGYTHATINGKQIHMQRFLLNPKKDEHVDHINLNKLDNRRKNLRLCTRVQNYRNKPKQINNRSGFKGVYWHKQRQKWAAGITTHKQIHLGLFDTREDAATAYNFAAYDAFKEFAFFNLVPQPWLESTNE